MQSEPQIKDIPSIDSALKAYKRSQQKENLNRSFQSSVEKVGKRSYLTAKLDSVNVTLVPRKESRNMCSMQAKTSLNMSN